MSDTVTAVRTSGPTTMQATYGEAVRAGLRRCLAEDERVLFYGEDVAAPGGVFGVTRNLQKEFGARVFDTPISESAILGSAVGAALLGMRPVVEIMWIDFSLVAMDQIVNQMANVRYVSNGELSAPIVIRTQQGSAPGACAQHSQSLEALFLHVPGIRVCMPSTAQDAYDLLVSAVHHDDPVLVIENRTLYGGAKSEVVVDGPPQPIGGLRRRRDGGDATVVTWGAITAKVLAAADRLATDGIEVTVLETPWLNPFPTAEVLDSAERTGRLAVVHEANLTGGFGAEVVAQIACAGVALRAAPMRIALPDVRVPAAPSLVAALFPDVAMIEQQLTKLVS